MIGNKEKQAERIEKYTQDFDSGFGILPGVAEFVKRDPCNCDDSTALANEVERLRLENEYMRKFMDASELLQMDKHLAAEWEARMFGNAETDAPLVITLRVCSTCSRTCDPSWIDERDECYRCAGKREDRRITRDDAEVDPFEPRGAF